MPMNRNDILEKLKEILLSADESSRDVIHLVNENTNLHTGLGLSSVNMLYLIIATEEVFGIYFDDIGLNELQTVGDVMNYIEGKLS